jgi:allantoicase
MVRLSSWSFHDNTIEVRPIFQRGVCMLDLWGSRRDRPSGQEWRVLAGSPAIS